MFNRITGWLYVIGLPARAKKLRQLLDRLPPGVVRVDDLGIEHYDPPMCPSRVLFGEREAAKLYADPATRPALDAWDQQFVGKDDMRRYCLHIERGEYKGPVFMPMKKQRVRAEERMAA